MLVIEAGYRMQWIYRFKLYNKHAWPQNLTGNKSAGILWHTELPQESADNIGVFIPVDFAHTPAASHISCCYGDR